MTNLESMEIEDEEVDFVIKNNKGKIHDKTKPLKIESVGREPIHIIDLSKKKIVNSSAANQKRLEALKEQKKDYKYKKSLIHSALSNIDNKTSKKTTFLEDTEKVLTNANNQNGNNKIDLFDGNMSDEDYHFDVREEFQTEKGQKLLHLESRYKNDKRFTLDSRFLDEQEQNCKQDDVDNEISLEEEKKKEYEILEQVLGKKINRKTFSDKNSQRKTMIRFDPTNPEHSKYVMPKLVKEKKKPKHVEKEIINEKKREETDIPEVSKDVFYRVSEDLKETFGGNSGFTLRSMFNQSEENDMEDAIPEATEILNNDFASQKNPFRYDSSDEEEDTSAPGQVDPISTDTQTITTGRAMSQDPFFFRKDDYRLQAGFDFVKKLAVKEVEDAEFAEIRRKTIKIVKAKIRNVQKKNQPFKKKLGGKKGKKALRMKKALKK